MKVDRMPLRDHLREGGKDDAREAGGSFASGASDF